MIKQIDSIHNFGIFRDYVQDSALSEFSRYNLIYGWNGSGKTTLSKLFYSLASKKTCSDFPDSNFVLSTNNGLIDTNNLDSSIFKVHVFNEQFIQENINWGKLVKSLLYVSKGKVEEKRKLNLAQDNLVNINRRIDELQRKNKDIERKNESFLSDTGREIKSQFEVLRTDDNYYINYDKRKLRKLIEKYNKLQYKRTIISKNNIDNFKILSKLEFLGEIILTLPNQIEIEEFEKFLDSINDNITQDLVSKSITSIKNNPTISTWVEAGIQIHKELKKCKFCGNPISEERIKKLKEHFNANYIKLKEEIINLLYEAENLKLSSEELPVDIEIYPFLKERFYKELNLIRKSIDSVNGIIDGYKKTLNLKLSNPFDTSFKKVRLSKASLNKLNKSIIKIAEIIQEHNETTNSFNQKVGNAKKSLELHYAHKELKAFNYFEKIKDIGKNKKEIQSLEEGLPPLENEISILEASLTDEILGAEEFNNKLHRFLNHRDIYLKFDKKNKGYQILRKNGKKKERAKYLSDGEKSAISFIFFLTKLNEDEEKLKNSIIVIDDPISSFDSNHLFNAYSFIRNSLNDSVLQLFILTHNFLFFKLIRDWMDKKNKKNKPIKSRFFYVQADYNKGIREANLFNADESLMQYNSEYHFLFGKIYKYKNQSNLSLDDCFIISNIVRKFLEIFLSFKYPKKRNDFYTWFNVALVDKRYDTMKDRVYKFINKYSHGDNIESFDSTTDNIAGESKSIIEDFLKIIKRIDSKHYDELVEIVNSK